MDWEAEGLLDGLEDDESRAGPGRAARLPPRRGLQVDELQAGGRGGPARAAAGRAPARRRQDLQPAPDRRGGRARARPPAASIARRSASRCPTPTTRCSATPTSSSAKDTAAIADAGFSTRGHARGHARARPRHGPLRRVAARAVRPDVPGARRLRARRSPAGSRARRRAAPALEPPARPRLPPPHAPAAAQRRHRDRRAHVGQGLRHAPRPRSRSPTSSASPSWGRPSTSRSSAGSPAGSRRSRARWSSCPCAWSSRSATR